MWAWASAHPYLTFFLALSGLNLVGYLLSPPCEGWRALSPACQKGPQPQLTSGTRGTPPWPLFDFNLPTGNGVYHGLVRG